MATKNKKKSKNPSASTLNKNLLRQLALEKIVEHNRDYLQLDITLPLGNKSLKKVHTNQWLWTELPSEFDLANWTILAKALNSMTNRYQGYVKNRWYIESNDITVNANGKAEMKLGLNAFASSLSSYSKEFRDLSKAYNDATTKKTTTTSASKKTTNAVGNNTTVKGGQGKVIDDLVKGIVGNTTDPLAKAKKIHAWLKKEVRYSRYCCAKYKTAESCYNNRRALNCADTATLTCRMMLSAGLNAYIVHRSHTNGHFWTVININGKIYASDQTGDGSDWNTIWYAYGDRRGCDSRGGNWDSKNGDFPDCYPSYSC